MLSSGIGLQKGCDPPDALIADEDVFIFNLYKKLVSFIPDTAEATGRFIELHIAPTSSGYRFYP